MSAQPLPKMSSSRWIWPFEIIEQIGEGGMGVVYRARYVVNNREVALKMVPADVTDRIALARFERELEVLKTLRHPNIVRCFGGVCENKRRFYAMELLTGGSLEDQLQKRGRIPWELVVQYGQQMCAALECSHGKGVVHRDVKPSNFLLTPDGQLKLSDFGLASVTSSRKITSAGKTAGTFLYMAPEQIRGNDVGPTTDLYALGCVLYELVTGRVPFQGGTPGETLHLHCYSVPDRPTLLAYDCPLQLERIILKLLEKAPEDRYQTAAQVSRELGLVTPTITVVPQRDGTHLDRIEPVEKQRKTPAEVRRKTAPIVESAIRRSRVITAALAAVLAASLLVNLSLFTGIGGGDPWHEQWVAASQSPDTAVRLAAINVFSEALPRHPEALQPLLSAVEDEEPTVRIAAVQGLGAGGAVARPKMSVVSKVHRTDPDERVRNAALLALQSLKSDTGSSIGAWIARALAALLIAGAGFGGWYWWQSRQVEENVTAKPAR